MSNTDTQINPVLLPVAAISGPKFDQIFKIMMAVGLGTIGINLFLPSGTFLPAWILIIQMFCFSGMLMMHLARCLGMKALWMYLLCMMGWEFFSEQIDIAFDGLWYGAHFAYTDLWGPRFMGVPIVPPVSIAVLVWPAFCCASMLLYGNYNVDHSNKPWLETIFFSLVCGVFISWLPVIYEAICINMGAYTYPAILDGRVEGYWGSPLGNDETAMPVGVFPGFTILVMLQVITFTRFIGPRFVAKSQVQEGHLNKLLDVAPVGFFFIQAAGMVKVASTMEATIFGVYTGLFFGLVALFAYYRNVVSKRS